MSLTKSNTILAWLISIGSFAFAQKLPTDKEIIREMRAVADYQLAQKWSQAMHPNGTLIMSPKTWEAGAFYPGILEIYRVTKDEKYLRAVQEIAESNNYERGPALRNADDQAILQTYLELYTFDKKLASNTKAAQLVG